MSSSKRVAALPKVLVVDDQPLIIQALYAILGDDYEVFMATSAAEAMQACIENPPDLILLDVIMPGMSGLDLCRALKRDMHTRDIPVMFVTAQNSPEEETAGLDVGAVDFISKPLNAPVVRARVRTHVTLKRQGDWLRSQALLDGLTGIPNRRKFDATLDALWRECARKGTPLSLIMLDVDHFKSYNDRYGHGQGDVCLRAIAAAIHSTVGDSRELAARYGGEEFACVLPECSLEDAMQRAEQILRAVESLQLEHLESGLPQRIISVSAGVACLIPDDALPCTELVVRADTLLYAAKAGGRNVVRGP
ncbi:MAG: diguanylate cyclase [Pseudomarimonas sp.]